ncbi:MAG TPA: TonB family protein [Allosphingosinicella sp.]|nr:TonB family protein [Allosphingosinicella sp.]
MTGAGFYQPRRVSPIGMATVILLHGVALTALMTMKMDMPGKRTFGHIDIFDVPEPPPPPPIPPPPPPPPSSAHLPTTHLTIPTQIVDVIQHPPSTVTPFPPLPPMGNNGTGPTPLPPVPPTPPPPRTFEPARAHANLGSYVSDIDYPDSARRNDEQGTTRFRLAVGIDGRVTGCTVVGSSGSSALDSATCRLMKNRARFTPARDSNGNATTDNVASAIRWVLPEG